MAGSIKDIVFYYKKTRYRIRYYRNAIGEKVIAYVMQSKGKIIVNESENKELYAEARRRIEGL